MTWGHVLERLDLRSLRHHIHRLPSLPRSLPRPHPPPLLPPPPPPPLPLPPLPPTPLHPSQADAVPCTKLMTYLSHILPLVYASCPEAGLRRPLTLSSRWGRLLYTLHVLVVVAVCGVGPVVFIRLLFCWRLSMLSCSNVISLSSFWYCFSLGRCDLTRYSEHWSPVLTPLWNDRLHRIPGPHSVDCKSSSVQNRTWQNK